MERELDKEFHKNVEGRVIHSLQYSGNAESKQVIYMTIYFKDGTTLGVGLDCTPEHHSMGFNLSSKQTVRGETE